MEPVVQTSSRSITNCRNGVALTLLVAFVISVIDKLNIGIFIADGRFIQDLGLAGKPVQIGLLMSTFLFSYALGFLLWGYLVDKVGAYRVLLVVSIVWGVLEAAQGLVQTPMQIYIVRVLLGVSEAALWPAAFVLIAKWFPLRERARANSIWLNGLNIGPAVGIAFTTYLITTLDWRLSFIITGILQMVILVPMILFLMAETPAQYRRISSAEREYIETAQAEEKAQIPEQAMINKEFKKVLLDYKYWLLNITWALDTLIFFTLNTWFAAYLKDVRNISLASAGTIVSLSFLIGVVFMIVAGRLSDRWNRRAPISVVGYLCAAIAVYLAVGAESALAAAVFLGMIIGFKNVGSLGTETILHHMGSTQVLGKLSGIHLTFTNLVAAFGPALFGLLIASAGGDFSNGFYSIIALFVIIAGISGVLARKGF
jgi:sugar phosphate permease